VDVTMGHHFTSTYPLSHFRSTFMLARHGVAEDGTPVQTTVTLEGVTERRAGTPSSQRPLDLDELPELLDRLGANLTSAETERLIRRLQGLHPVP
jgi:N-hydroxyarylamine O-acetyltransferase